ncbi:hypothetical protein CDV36_014563, partial [Fusarium kuroshium]
MFGFLWCRSYVPTTCPVTAQPHLEPASKVCPMQWDIYDENNQHSTLYHFLGVSPTAKRDDILIAYQQAIQKSEIETRPCLDSIIDETGERITEGIPQACHTDEYALAGKRHGLITRAAGVLTDENQAQKLYDIHFLSAMYQIEDMGDKVADKSNLAKWKKNMGKMMRQQSEIRKSMCSLCGAINVRDKRVGQTSERDR